MQLFSDFARLDIITDFVLHDVVDHPFEIIVTTVTDLKIQLVLTARHLSYLTFDSSFFSL